MNDLAFQPVFLDDMGDFGKPFEYDDDKQP